MEKIIAWFHAFIEFSLDIVTKLPLVNKFNRSTLRMLFIYIFLGGIAFLVDYSFLYLFASVMGMHYLAAAALSFCAGVTTNYLLNRKFNFKSTRQMRTQFPVFVSVSLISLALNEVFLFVLVEYFNLHYLVAKPVILLVLSPVSFGLHKTITFRD